MFDATLKAGRDRNAMEGSKLWVIPPP
jgi:hypothetical protein